MLCAAYSEKDGLKRGQVKITVRQLAASCGFKDQEISRFLKKCERAGDIVWKKGQRWTKSVSENVSENVSDVVSEAGIITICNYDKYNPPVERNASENDSKSEPDDVPSYNNKKEQERIRTPPNPPKPRVNSQPPKKLDELKKLLGDIDLQYFKEEWEPQGLDVDSCWEDFQDYVLGNNPKKPYPNPSNWKAFDKAFRNSCKSSLKKGMHVKTEDSYDEKLARLERQYGRKLTLFEKEDHGLA